MKQETIKKMMCMTHKMKLFHSRMRKKAGVTDAEFVVLIAIAEKSRSKKTMQEIPASTTDVARHMGATLPAASKMIRNLSIKGYVMQMPGQSDRRETRLVLTEKGKDILKESFQKRQKILKNVFIQFGEEKTEQFIELMEELTNLLEKEVAKKDV